MMTDTREIINMTELELLCRFITFLKERDIKLAKEQWTEAIKKPGIEKVPAFIGPEKETVYLDEFLRSLPERPKPKPDDLPNPRFKQKH